MKKDFKAIAIHVDDKGILTIKLNRPNKYNALDDITLQELGETFLWAKHEKKVKGILLTGEGKAFCAGADINRLEELDVKAGLQFAMEGQSVMRFLETLGKPSVAAINGFCFGGGCELAMAASLRIASVKASFGQPEVKLGVIPGFGGTQRLARLVGKGRALDLCLSGRSISAETALEWGLVTHVAAEDKLLEQAYEILLGITEMAPVALHLVLKTIDQGYDMPLEEALYLEATHFSFTCATEDKNIGVSAFLEKRKPEFCGE